MSPRSRGWSDPRGAARSANATPVSDVVAGLLAERAFAAGVAVGRLARAWPRVVGDRLARETRPARLEAGTLVVHAVSGPWGSQARFLAEEIRKRANEALGTEQVQRVHVVVAPELGDRPRSL